MQTSVALAAHKLVLFVFTCESHQSWVNNTSAQSEHQMEGGLLLDVVILKGAAILELLACEDQTLLVWWDAFLVLDLGLDGINSVGALDFESDGLAGECLDEDLHASTEPEHQMKSGLLLDVVILKGTAILELLACEDETLLVWWDALLVLDL